jgi:hypothetical protein
MQINRLLLLLTTGGGPGGGILGAPDTPHGSTNLLEIQVVASGGRLCVLFEIFPGTQGGLRSGQANFYSAPVIASFTKNDLSDQSITLRTKGFDDWEPASLFLFGLDAAVGRPGAVIPLVHLPEWPHGVMKADLTNGAADVTLALAADDLRSPGGVVTPTSSLPA